MLLSVSSLYGSGCKEAKMWFGVKGQTLKALNVENVYLLNNNFVDKFRYEFPLLFFKFYRTVISFVSFFLETVIVTKKNVD